MQAKKQSFVFKDFVSINGNASIKLHYACCGSTLKNKINPDQPTLIILHGGPGFDHSIHMPFWSTLASDGIQVIFPDQRGHGLSEGLDKPTTWNLKQWGDDVYQFCVALNIKYPIVGGVSFGGVVAQSYMLQHPKHPAGIILCDTDAHMDKTRMLNTFYERAKVATSSEEKALRVRTIAEKVFKDPADQAILEEHFKNGIPLCGKNKYDTEKPLDCILHMEIAKKYFNEEIFNYDFRPEFASKICFPVLVMYGDKNAVHSKESALETIAALPKGVVQAEYFKDAATPVYDNDPQRAKAVAAFFVKSCYEKVLSDTKEVKTSDPQIT